MDKKEKANKSNRNSAIVIPLLHVVTRKLYYNLMGKQYTTLIKMFFVTFIEGSETHS